MKVEIVKTVVEEYELTEEDAIKIIDDYDGDVKEYVQCELEPYNVDEAIEEINYNIDELRSIEAKMKDFSPGEWFVKYGSLKIPCENNRLNDAVNPTEEQMKLIKTLMPFTHKYNSNFGLEFQGVRLFKDYAEASDLVVLIRINTDTGLPDKIDFSLVGEAALEFDRKDILLCKNMFAVKVYDGCLIPSNSVEDHMDTHKKLNVDKNKGKAVDVDVLIREMVEIRMELLHRINDDLKAKGKALVVETEYSTADVEYKSLYVDEKDGYYFADELDSYVVELYEKSEKNTTLVDELSDEDMFEVAMNVDLKNMCIEMEE